MTVNPMTAPTDAMVETLLTIFHGRVSWQLIKNQWPEAALIEQRRKMAEVIAECSQEARRLSGCLLVIAGAEGCGNGALRAASYEVATTELSPGELATKLGLPTSIRRPLPAPPQPADAQGGDRE